MALYGHKLLSESASEDIEFMSESALNKYVQMIAYDDLSMADDATIKEFCESAAADVLLERQVLNKGSLMRLSKADDEKRRIKLICYQLAKENNDSDFKKMIMHRTKMKEYRAKVIKKYGKKAGKIAKVAQKEYIKRAKKEPMKKSDTAK